MTATVDSVVKRWRPGLAVKLLVPLLLVLVGTQVLVEWLWWPRYAHHQRLHIEQAEQRQLVVLGSVIAESLMAEEDARRATLLWNARESRKQWRELRLYGRDGVLLFPSRSRQTPVGARILRIDHVVKVNGHALGRLELFVDASEEFARARAEFRAMETLLMGVCLAAVVLASLLLERVVRRPLLRLTVAAGQMARGDYSVALDPTGSDEIGSLTRSFAQMREQVQSAQQALREQADEMRDSKERAERALAELAFHKQALDRHSIVAVTDPKGRIIEVNDKFCEISGYAREELIGQTHRIVNSGAHSREFFRQMWATIGRGEIWQGEICNRAKGGRLYWVDSSIVPFRDVDGRISRYVAIRTDITARKAAEVAMEQARLVAEQASRAKTEFLANMSHEIRTPMNGVLGMLEMLRGDSLPDPQKEYVEVAYRSGESMLSLINDILDLSKIEAGRLDIESIPFEVRSLVEDVVGLHFARAEKKGLVLACMVDATVPDRVAGDPTRLRQVLNNLVSNAVKFTATGEVMIKVNILSDRHGESAMADGAALLFSVADTGVGVAPEQRSTIFEPFVQADGSITRRYGGTGLGLAISKRLVNAMGGDIGLTDRPQGGSIFSFAVRVGQVAAGATTWQPCEALEGIRVMLVAQDDASRQALASNLAQWGMALCVAETPAAALASLQRAATEPAGFELILLGHHPPELDGFALAEQIRAHVGEGAPRLIMLSGSGYRGQAGAAQRAGFQGYLGSPVRAHELHDAVSAVLGLGSAATALVTRHTVAEQKAAGSARILVVEDNSVNQQVALAMLNRMGHRVDVADNGEVALQALSNRPYDVVLMDMQMPVLDGVSATREWRVREAEQRRSRTPILAMTANALEADRQACLEAGMDDFIVKPFSYQVLCQALGRWLGRGAKAPAIDLDDVRLGELRHGLASGYPALVSTYLDDTARRIEALEAQLEGGEPKAKVRLAADLRISSQRIGVRSFDTLGSELESALEQGDQPSVRRILAELRATLPALVQALEDTLS